jgi:hypothetical protein
MPPADVAVPSRMRLDTGVVVRRRRGRTVAFACLQELKLGHYAALLDTVRRYRVCLNAIAATPDRWGSVGPRKPRPGPMDRPEVSPVDVFDHLGKVAPMSFEGSPGHTG